MDPTAAYRSAWVAAMMAAAARLPTGLRRDPLRIDRIVPHDLASDAGDQRRLAAVPLLVAVRNQFQHFDWLAPGLLRIQTKHSLLRQEIIRVPAAKSSGDWVQP